MQLYFRKRNQHFAQGEREMRKVAEGHRHERMHSEGWENFPLAPSSFRRQGKWMCDVEGMRWVLRGCDGTSAGIELTSMEQPERA